jgi:transposase
LTLIGYAVGGEAGNKLVEGMKLSISPDTLLRLIRATPDKPFPTPRILGVDDFAFRRRRTYGTILIDLEKRLPVDLLPDREAESLAKWLMVHPGVELVSRDRGGDYAKGIKQGAPDAKQIADRWHILKNLSETMQHYFLRKHPQLKAASTELTSASSEPTVPTVPGTQA